MPIETNPFRMSMIQRSESPEDPFNTHQSNPYTSAGLPSPQPQDTGSSTQSNGHESIYALPRVRNNPFRVDLSDSPTGEYPQNQNSIGNRQTSGGLEPPSYFESEGRRHSDPNLTRPDEEKGRLAARDEIYKEGYEEGMRIARERERQRRREYRERRSREGHGSSSSSTSRRPDERRKHSDHSHRSNSGSGRSHSGSGQTHSESRESRSSRTRSKSESAGSSSRRKPKNNESLDVIDKLDATGIYGSIGFHHDGPFDACTPHRNSSKSKRSGPAPIAAFPADGPNNSLAVENPAFASFRKDEAVFGRDIIDVPPEVSQASFDPTDRGHKVHGERTYGLGSTTFIDGTPASRDAIKREATLNAGGLGRSKSLLRRQPSASRKPEFEDEFGGEEPKSSLLSRVRSLRVGRH